MKKIFLFFAVMCLALMLTGCSCKHKNTEVRGAYDPTCTSTGYSGDTFCLDCSTTILAGQEIPKGAHTLDTEPEGAFDPTCDLPGFAGNTYCTECGDLAIKGSIIAPYGHITGELKYVTEAYCVKAGFTGSAYCEKCGFAVIAGKEIPQLGHVFETKENYIAPTCTSKGSYDSTCTRCGYISEDMEEPKLPHTFENGFCAICGWQEVPGLYEGETLKYTWDQLIEQGLIRVSKYEPMIQEIDPSLTGRLVIAEDYDYESDAMYGCPFTEIWFPYNIHSIRNLKGSTNLERIRYFSPEAHILHNTFKDCTALKEIEITANGMCRVESNCFENCTSLEKVTFQEYVDSVSDSAFKGCTSLKELVFPDTEDENASFVVWENAFAGCTSLEKLVLPSSLFMIEKDAFYGCSALEKLVLPKGRYKMDNKAFSGCKNLTVYFRMSEADVKAANGFVPTSIPQVVFDYTGE